MKIKLKIQQKIQFFIISSSILIYIAAVGYISFNARKMAYNDAVKKTQSYANETAKDIKNQLDADLTIVKTFAEAFGTYKELETPKWKELFSKMYYKVFENNPHIYSIWDSWELSMIDPEWEKPFGRYVCLYWRENGIIKEDSEFRSLDGDPELYAEIKKSKIPAIWEPYEDVYADNKAERFLMTSVNAPILDNGKYVGIVAIDITLDKFQALVEKIKPYEGSNAFIISNKGVIAGHPDKDLLNKKIEDIFPDDEKENSIQEKILKGKNLDYISSDNTFYCYTPIFVGETNTPWSIAISIPVEVMMAKANKNFRISLIVGIIEIGRAHV